MLDLVLVAMLTTPTLLAAAFAGRSRRQRRTFTEGWVRYLEDSIEDAQTSDLVPALAR